MGEDGSFAIYQDSDVVTRYSADGEKMWDFHPETTPKGAPFEALWFQGKPIIDKDGNTYIAAVQKNTIDNQDDLWKTHLTKLDKDGKEVFHREFSSSKMFSDLRQAPNGDLVLGTLSDDTNTDQKSRISNWGLLNNPLTERLFRVSNRGLFKSSFTVPRYYEDNSTFKSVNFTPDSDMMIETIEFKPGTDKVHSHERKLTLIKNDFYKDDLPGDLDEANDNGPGVVKKTDKFIIINGVKLPVNKP